MRLRPCLFLTEKFLLFPRHMDQQHSVYQIIGKQAFVAFLFKMKTQNGDNSVFFLGSSMQDLTYIKSFLPCLSRAW